MSEKYLEKYAQVLDPFCGVGTLLIERNKLVRTRTMYGIDIFGEAIEGGRQNAVLAGVGINYICRNFSTSDMNICLMRLSLKCQDLIKAMRMIFTDAF